MCYIARLSRYEAGKRAQAGRLLALDRGVLAVAQQAPVATGAIFEGGELAVGGALRAAGHPPACGEVEEGIGDAEGLRVGAATFVEGGEPLVGVAADEPSATLSS